MGRDRLRLRKLEARVDARSREDVESAGEFVLMNIRGAVQPEKDLDVEPRVVIDHEFGLTEAGLGLKRLPVFEQKIPDEGGDMHMRCGRPIFEHLSRDVGKEALREVHFFPPRQNLLPEFGEKWIHDSICGEHPIPGKTQSLPPDSAGATVWRESDNGVEAPEPEPSQAGIFLASLRKPPKLRVPPPGKLGRAERFSESITNPSG